MILCYFCCCKCPLKSTADLLKIPDIISFSLSYSMFRHIYSFIGHQNKYHMNKFHPPQKSKVPRYPDDQSPTHRDNNNSRKYTSPQSWSPSHTPQALQVPNAEYLKPEEYIIVDPVQRTQYLSPVHKPRGVQTKVRKVYIRREQERLKSSASTANGQHVASETFTQASVPFERPKGMYVQATGWRSLSETEKAAH